MLNSLIFLNKRSLTFWIWTDLCCADSRRIQNLSCIQSQTFWHTGCWHSISKVVAHINNVSHTHRQHTECIQRSGTINRESWTLIQMQNEYVQTIWTSTPAALVAYGTLIILMSVKMSLLTTVTRFTHYCEAFNNFKSCHSSLSCLWWRSLLSCCSSTSQLHIQILLLLYQPAGDIYLGESCFREQGTVSSVGVLWLNVLSVDRY
jgi:hypothetical protein